MTCFGTFLRIRLLQETSGGPCPFVSHIFYMHDTLPKNLAERSIKQPHTTVSHISSETLHNLTERRNVIHSLLGIFLLPDEGSRKCRRYFAYKKFILPLLYLTTEGRYILSASLSSYAGYSHERQEVTNDTCQTK
jgi:hypothetical protein